MTFSHVSLEDDHVTNGSDNEQEQEYRCDGDVDGDGGDASDRRCVW